MFGRKKDKKMSDKPEENQEEVPTENNNETPPAQDDQSRIAELEAKLLELNDKHLRLFAEFENFKKRTLRERVELIKSAGEDVFKLVLPVMDDFERALKANENAKDVKTVNEGVSLV